MGINFFEEKESRIGNFGDKVLNFVSKKQVLCFSILAIICFICLEFMLVTNPGAFNVNNDTNFEGFVAMNVALLLLSVFLTIPVLLLIMVLFAIAYLVFERPLETLAILFIIALCVGVCFGIFKLLYFIKHNLFEIMKSNI